MPATQLRKYGEATKIVFHLTDYGTTDLETAASFATNDVKVIKDEGVVANAASPFVNEGNGLYSLALSAMELQCARLYVAIVDQPTSTVAKVWEDEVVVVETYGVSAAQHGLAAFFTPLNFGALNTYAQRAPVGGARRAVWLLDHLAHDEVLGPAYPSVQLYTKELSAGSIVIPRLWWAPHDALTGKIVSFQVQLDPIDVDDDLALNQPEFTSSQSIGFNAPNTAEFMTKTDLPSITVPDHTLLSVRVRRITRSSTHDTHTKSLQFHGLEFIEA